MPTLQERVKADLIAAMKAKDKDKVVVLRLIMNDIKMHALEKRVDATLSDDILLCLLVKMLKQRKDSISQFEKACRLDLVAKEQAQIDIIATYMPKQLGETEITKLVAEVIAENKFNSVKDLGKIMAVIKKSHQSSVDLSLVSSIAKQELLSQSN